MSMTSGMPMEEEDNQTVEVDVEEEVNTVKNIITSIIENTP